MKIAFNSPARKWLTAAVALVFAVLYLGLAARELVASVLADPTQLVTLKTWVRLAPVSGLKAAVLLDPGNADYRNRLGRYRELLDRDPVAAIGHFQAAVQLNPHSARYWFDLASAYQVLGDTANQTAALERAIQADTMTPDVAWEAANLYLVQGENQKALREFRVVLANDSSLASSAIRFCWRISPDVDTLLRDAVPPTAEAYIAFLTLLEDKITLQSRSLISPTDDTTDVESLTRQIKTETVDTAKVWNALMQTPQTFERRYADQYFDFLILRRDEVDQAIQVWRQTVDRFGLSPYWPSSANLVVNNKFNLAPLNAGLDWHFVKQYGVKWTYPSDSHFGHPSLLINFDGPGISDAGFYQYVPVQPSTTYEFSAYYKNGELDGAGGPHFTVHDMYNPKTVYYESDKLKDAEEWKSVHNEFTTGPDCKLVVVHIRRLPEGSPIRGKLWVGDFRLFKKPS